MQKYFFSHSSPSQIFRECNYRVSWERTLVLCLESLPRSCSVWGKNEVTPKEGCQPVVSEGPEDTPSWFCFCHFHARLGNTAVWSLLVTAFPPETSYIARDMNSKIKFNFTRRILWKDFLWLVSHVYWFCPSGMRQALGHCILEFFFGPRFIFQSFPDTGHGAAPGPFAPIPLFLFPLHPLLRGPSKPTASKASLTAGWIQGKQYRRHAFGNPLSHVRSQEIVWQCASKWTPLSPVTKSHFLIFRSLYFAFDIYNDFKEGFFFSLFHPTYIIWAYHFS